jgi:hypothetical protein
MMPASTRNFASRRAATLATNSSMKDNAQHNPLPEIAADTVQRTFGLTIDDGTRREFVESLVRQWERFGGYAGLFTMTQSFWFVVTLQEKPKINVKVGMAKGNIVADFMKDWHFTPAQIPDILHQLNVNQYALLMNAQRQKLRFTINPEKRSVSIDEPDRPRKKTS